MQRSACLTGWDDRDCVMSKNEILPNIALRCHWQPVEEALRGDSCTYDKRGRRAFRLQPRRNQQLPRYSPTALQLHVRRRLRMRSL